MSGGTGLRALLLGALLLVASTVCAGDLKQPESGDYSSIAFVPNSGQFRADVAFVARTRTDQIFILNDGRILHALPTANTAGARKISAWVVLEELPGTTAAARGARISNQRVSWLNTVSSTPSSAPTSFSALEWSDAWPGIDMLLQIADDRTERVFRLKPGADWKQIALSYEGAHFELDADGGLTARDRNIDLTLSAPIAFQDTQQGRVSVDVRYVVAEEGKRVSFEVGAHDRRLPLIIDPVLQATYFGFGGQSRVTALAIDPATGDLIAAGTSLGLGVPGVAGGFQTLHNADAGFVTRIDAKLRQVKQTTLIGGAAADEVRSVAIHPQTGEIYVAGVSDSPGFPGGGGGAAPNLGGASNDGFVSRFSADLRTLLQTTFTNQARTSVHARDLAISATTGDVYVAAEGFNPYAAYVLRFNRQLTVQLGRAALEGSSFSRALSVALNEGTGDVYVAGGTSSRTFPLTAGGLEEMFQGEGGDGEAVFIARFDATLDHLQSTYLSDMSPRAFNFTARPSPKIAVHTGSGELYVAGVSSRTDLPNMGGAQPTYAGGSSDVVVTRLSPDLKQRRGTTYFGGSNSEELSDITFTPDGAHLYIAGFSSSSNLPALANGAISTNSDMRAGYIARLSASLSTIDQTTYFTPSVSNLAGGAIAIHPGTNEAYWGGQCSQGIPETTGGLQPVYGGELTSFGTGCLARFDALLSGGQDLDPDAFAFTDQYGVAPGAEVTSAPIRIDGITGPIIVSVSNGSFSVDGGPFDATAREVRRGQNIRVRHTASTGFGVTTQTTLTARTRSETFRSTVSTGTGSTPFSLEFATREPVALDIDVQSEPVLVERISTPASISIVNGEYSIDGGEFSSAAGATINAGQTIAVRHRSAGAPATTTATTLTVGGLSTQFRSTTDPVDDAVHPISVADEANTPPNFDASSQPVMVIGINVPVPVSVVGAEWSTDGITFRSGPGFVENFTPIALRMRSGPPGTTVTATLTVGDQSDTWVLGQPQLGDTTPDPFSFAPQNNAAPLSYVLSNEITVTGIDVPVWVDAGSGAFFDHVSGLYLSSGFISNGTRTRIRLFTFAGAGARVETRVRIGTGEAVFSVQNATGGGTPTPFDFANQSGVAAGTSVISNTVTVSGLTGGVTATVSGCELSVNGGSFAATSPIVNNGDQLRLRMTASATAGAMVTCTLNIAGVEDQFSVTTAQTSSGGGGSSSSGGRSGGGGGSLDYAAVLGLALLTLSRRRLKCTHARRFQ